VPSPVGHFVAGLTVHILTARDAGETKSLPRVALVAGAAVAPDLDLLGRFVDGVNRHQHESHSLGFALGAGLVASLLARRFRLRPLATGLATTLGWSSHVLLDYLAVDTSPPIGIMALWPLSRGYYHFPHPIFMDIWRTLEWKAVVHDSVALAWELVVLIPLLLASLWLRSFTTGVPWHEVSRASR
jgi:inner membrane protein